MVNDNYEIEELRPYIKAITSLEPWTTKIPLKIVKAARKAGFEWRDYRLDDPRSKSYDKGLYERVYGNR